MQNFRGERDKKEGGGGKRDVVLGGGAFGENGLPSSAPPSQDGEVSKRKRGEVSKAEMRDGKSKEKERKREKRDRRRGSRLHMFSTLHNPFSIDLFALSVLQCESRAFQWLKFCTQRQTDKSILTYSVVLSWLLANNRGLCGQFALLPLVYERLINARWGNYRPQ